MKKNDVLSILITFAVGFFAGAYLYIGHFATVFVPDTVSTAEKVNSLSIVSEAYGGCRNACPSFQISYDGSYRWRYFTTGSSEPLIRDGVLPLNLERALKQNLVAEQLSVQSVPVSPTECRSFSDGIDVRYEIILDGVRYKLDGCGTNIDRNSLAWLSLSAVWEYLQTLE